MRDQTRGVFSHACCTSCVFWTTIFSPLFETVSLVVINSPSSDLTSASNWCRNTSFHSVPEANSIRCPSSMNLPVPSAHVSHRTHASSRGTTHVNPTVSGARPRRSVISDLPSFFGRSQENSDEPSRNSCEGVAIRRSVSACHGGSSSCVMLRNETGYRSSA